MNSSEGHNHHNHTQQTNSNLSGFGPPNVHKLRPISPSGKENADIFESKLNGVNHPVGAGQT